MNPISATPASGRATGTSEAGAVPTDLAGVFAMLFAATTQAAPVPTPVPLTLPNGTSAPALESCSEAVCNLTDPEAAPRAEGEVPQSPPGGWPGAVSRGLPTFPASAAPERSRLEPPGLTPAFEDLAPPRRDLAPPLERVVPEAVPIAGSTRPEAMALPEGMTLRMPSEAAPVLAAAIAAAVPAPRAAVASTPAANTPAEPATVPGQEGEPVLADLARDGGRNIGRRNVPARSAEREAGGVGARLRGKPGAQAGKAERDARGADPSLPSAFPDVADPSAPATPVPVAPLTHAHAAGASAPQPKLPDLPAPSGAAPAAPVELPAEPQTPLNPSHATVSFDSGDGQEGRLRVSLRGDTLRATIQVPDAAAAQRLEQDLGELSRALRTHGFEQARLTIDAPRAATNAERGSDDAQPREHRNLRDERSHSGERNSARRERGTSRQER